MIKYDNDWSIEVGDYDPENREVVINSCTYKVDDKTACMAHSLLLILDAIND